LALCIAALLGLAQLWRTASPYARIMIGTLGLIVALLLPFPILRFFLTKNVLETGQGRHILYPAAQSIPILLMLGWLTFTNHLSQWPMVNTNIRPTSYALRTKISLSLIPVLLFIWSLFQYAYMSTTYPEPLPVQTTTFNPDSIPQPIIPQKFGDEIQLLGYDFQPDPEMAIINLTLFWEALETVDQNYRVQVELLDADKQPYFAWLSHPVNGLYPTRAWDKGDVVRDELPLPLAAVPPGNYTLNVNLLPEAGDKPLLAEPYWLVQIPLGQRRPIAQAEPVKGVDYRLWVADQPVRHRQTVPLSWLAQDEELSVKWNLVGPDDVPRSPVARSDNTDIFIVEADWPSGDYRLQFTPDAADPVPTDTKITVANDRRLFEFTPPENYVPVEANFADQVKLLGYSLPTRRIEPGGGLPVTLYWQSLAPVLGDYVVFDVLLDENQQRFGGYDRLPLEFYSTILWAEGEIVEDGFAVPVQPDAPPGVYTLRVGLYSETADGPVSLPVHHDGQPTENTSISLGPIKVGGPPPALVTDNPHPQVPLQQSFGGQITLLGYDLEMTASTVNLTLYWRADTDVQANYTTFLHIRDQTNAMVKQKDSPPAGGRYPTALWEAGEIVV
ncbi:MAG: hypothetical protein R3264_20505, partial [Anaerolineae bacterium]|nr:hypothetical protein [Anaerolineae bacterium]